MQKQPSHILPKLFAGMLLIAPLGALCSEDASSPIDYFGLTPPGETPELFAPSILAKPEECISNATFTPDGREFAYTLTDRDWMKNRLMHTRRIGDKWSTPEPFPFTTDASLVPFFSYDGKSLYFTLQDRSHDATFAEIWVSPRVNGEWSEPKKLPSPINMGKQFECSMTRDGDLYFSSDRPSRYHGAGVGMFRSQLRDGVYQQPEELGPRVNLGPVDECPAIAPDGSYLVFNSFRGLVVGGGFGHNDLYVSFRKPDGSWTNPKSMGPLFNTWQIDVYPYISPDGKYLFFTRRQRPKGCDESSRLYWVSTRVIEKLRQSNFIPYAKRCLGGLSAVVGQPFAFTVPADVFIDDNPDDRLTLHVVGMPSWLTFDPATRTFTGTPNAVGDAQMTLIADDGRQGTCSVPLNLFVVAR